MTSDQHSQPRDWTSTNPPAAWDRPGPSRPWVTTAFVFGWLLLLLAPTGAAAQPTHLRGDVQVGTGGTPGVVVRVFFSERLKDEHGPPPASGIPMSTLTIKRTRDGVTSTLSFTGHNTVTSDRLTIYIYSTTLITRDDIVTVSYAAPTSGARIQSHAMPRTDAASFSDFRARNWVGYNDPKDSTDKTAPNITSVTLNADGTRMDVLFNEAMETNTALVSSLFTLTGTSAAVTGTPNFGGGNTTLSLSLSPAVQSTEKPTLIYHPATANVEYLGYTLGPEYTFILDINHNPVHLFRRPAVRAGESDTTAPSVRTAELKGKLLTLTFDEDLGQTAVPDKSRFTLAGTSNNAAVSAVAFKTNDTVSEVTEFTKVTQLGDLTAIELTLDKVPSGTAITLSYAKGTDANPLEDTAGNDVANFTGQTVTIQTDTTPPTYKSAWVIGSTLTARFSEELDTTAAPDKSRFTLTFTGGGTMTTATVTAVAFKSDDANALELTISPAVTASEKATSIDLDYTKGTEANPLKDPADNEVADFNDFVGNWTGRPRPERAEVDGSVLTVTFTEDLDTTSIPPTNRFSMDGTTATVTAVAFKSGDAKSVELTLSAAVTAGETGIALQYVPPLSNKLQNTATSPVTVHGFVFWKVWNVADGTAPTVTTATVNGALLTLTFSEDLDTTAAPAASRFSVSGAANATTVTAVGFKSNDATSLELTLNPAVTAGETGITVAYAKGSDANPLKDKAPTPNEVANFSGVQVTNNTPDTTAPTVASATVDGTVLTLTFSEFLDTTATPAASRFTVSGTASATTVTAVAFKTGDARSVELTLSPAVTAGRTGITVAYAKGADANPLKDRASPANEVANFSGQEVLTVVTLVSNTGQTLGTTRSFGTTPNRSQAQTFTTGSNSTGYTLSGVDVRLASGIHSTSTQVSIYTTSSGSPDSSLHVLNTPSSLPQNTTVTFTADAGATLAANTTYAVVLEDSSGDTAIRSTASDNEDSGGSAGWSIGDKKHARQGSGSWTQALPDSLVIAIKGAAKTGGTPTSVVSITGGAAVTEGGSAVFTVSASPAPASALTVSLTVSQTGSFVAAGGLGSKTVTVPTSGSATYSVATVDDGTEEPNGSVTATLAAGSGYTLHATDNSASVTVNDDDGPLVSNTGETSDGSVLQAGTLAGVNWSVAQTFTTGSNPGGYTLSSVDAKLGAGTQSANTQVSVYSTSGSPAAPDSSLHVLTNPSSLTASATNTFTAPANATLAANTTYAVVFEVTSGSDTIKIDRTTSGNEAGAAGWSIANKRHDRQGSGSWTQPGNNLLPLIAIWGKARPTLVSNTGQTSSGPLTVGWNGLVRFDRALSFTTGGNPLGYTLSAVDVKVGRTHDAGTRVSIYETSSGSPTSSLHVLNNPTTRTVEATNTFTADAGTTLDANTTYAVVIEVPSGLGDTILDRTDSHAEDAGAASGWSIANNRYTREDGGGWTGETPEKPMIAILGKAKTAPPPGPGPGPGPPGTPVVSITGGRAVTEGTDASFTVSASPAPAAALTVNLTVTQTGNFVDPRDLGAKTVTVPTSGSALFTVPTVDDSVAEANGSVTLAAAAGSGYSLSSTSASASRIVRDNDGPEPSCQSRIAPYWHGTGGFVVRASDGRSANVRLTCRGRTYDYQEYAGDDGLVARLISRNDCMSRDGSSLELAFEGVEPGGWYWNNGDRNVAVAPLACRESLTSALLPPPLPAAITASPSGDLLFLRSILGRDYGRFLHHDPSDFVGIVPHLVDSEGSGEHVAPFWKGHGGVVGRPLDGDSATFRLTCGEDPPETFVLEAGEDGLVIALLRPGCHDDDGAWAVGDLEVDGLEDGGWYWISNGESVAVAPFLARGADRSNLSTPVVPGGGVDSVEEGPLGTLFVKGSRMGIVPRIQEP